MDTAAPALRNFASADAEAVNRVAVAAFAPFAPHYNNGPALAANLAKMSALAETGEGARVIALHTSPVMTVALPMYQRMGIVKLRDAPPIFGVEYAIHTKAL